MLSSALFRPRNCADGSAEKPPLLNGRLCNPVRHATPGKSSRILKPGKRASRPRATSWGKSG